MSNTLKNGLVLGLALISCFAFLNYGAKLRFENIERQTYPRLILTKIPGLMDEVHHFRDKKYFRGSFESLIFDGAENSSTLILGDSWIERFSDETFTTQMLSEVFDEIPLNAGVGSYSPTLMLGMFNYLKENYKISPSRVLIYLDQTDFGDEIVRYKKIYGVDFLKKSIFFDRKKRSNDSWHNQVNIYELIKDFSADQNILGWINFEYKKFRLKTGEKTKHPSFSEILDFLQKRPKPDDRKHFLERLSSLVDRIHDSGIQKVALFTHPHRGHLTGQFTFDVQEFALEFGRAWASRAATNSDKRGGQLCVIRLDPKESDVDAIFFNAQEDPASHLKGVFQSKRFPLAVAKAANTCFQRGDLYQELGFRY